jgi:uncharacterized membrane protein YfhO
MTQNTKPRLYIFLSCAGFNIAILLLYFLINDKSFAFVDIGADTYTDYYPLQMEFAKQLHNLQLFTWSFSAGLGNYFAWQSNLLFLIDALFPQSWQLALRLPTYALLLLLAGSFMYGYFRKVGFDSAMATAGALAFTFCDYATIYGQWDTQGYVLAQLSAYLFCCESYLQERKTAYAVFAGLIVATGNAFDTYTFTLVTLSYLIFRPLFSSKEENTASYISSVQRYIGWALVGSMLASFSLVPKLIYLLSSSRVSGNSSIFSTTVSGAFTLTSPAEIAAEISGLLGKNIYGVGSDFKGIINWFEAPGFYVGVLLVICIPQLFASNSSGREKRLGLVGLALLVFYILSPLIRYTAFGFGHDGYRVSTLFISLCIVTLGITGLRHIYQHGVWLTGLIIGTIFVVLLSLTIAFHNRTVANFHHIILLIIFSTGYCFLLWPTRSGKPRTAPLTIIIVLTGELLLSSIPSFINRNAVSTNATFGIDKQGTDTLAAIEFIKAREPKDAFFRISKTYGQGFPNEPMVMGYNGTTSYFLQDKSTTSFIEGMGLQPRPVSNIVTPIINRPKLFNLLGVRYVLTDDQGALPDTQFSYIKGFGGVKVYLNNGPSSIAKLYDNLITETDADAMTTRERDNATAEGVIVGDLPGIREQLTSARLKDGGSADFGEFVSVRKLSDTHLSCQVDTSRSRIMLLAIPFNKGWSATIDSVRAKLFRVDYGLTALIVPAGSHDIEFRYSPLGFMTGIWLSMISLLFIAWYVLFKRKHIPLQRRLSTP